MTDASYLSGYRLMWIFVMFDLPVGTKKQMRDATNSASSFSTKDSR